AVAQPRFRLAWDQVLNRTLQAMGMVDAFRPGAADVSGLSEASAGLHIPKVKQKTFVRVDEEGTEAAAVTSVAVVESLGPVLRADRPFVVVIRERLTGTVLFVGVLVEPPTAP
ncbi:MAG: serpin family protein, partial [Gemmatimonadetes bacterium]|nr:serpin family protein [Gemmatimonadota bacterium]